MKKLMLILGFMILASNAHAGRTYTTENTGDDISMYTFSISSASSVEISSYSESRNFLSCQNLGIVSVLLSTYSLTGTTSGYTLFASTFTWPMYQTTNHSAIFAHLGTGSASTDSVACVEERIRAN